MGNSTWGMLAKSADDNETIEQAIARLILAHEEDAESHLGVGESLQSHKASEIIDHLANSIVADKILANQIYGIHFDTSKFLIRPAFESVDAYNVTKTGVTSDVQPAGAGRVLLLPGSTNGNRVAISCDLESSFRLTQKNPCLDFYVSDGQRTANLWFGFGSTNLDNSTQGGLFFRWEQSTKKLFAAVRYKDEVSPYTTYLYETEILSYINLQGHVLRIEVDDINNCVKFYFDGVLEHTHDFVVGKVLTLVTSFSFVAVMASGGEVGYCNISNLQYYQDI